MNAGPFGSGAGTSPNSSAAAANAEKLAHPEPDSDRKLEPGMALALSGGGYRAMLFHAGALMRLNEFGLLSQLERISSVSGGSITAGFLAKRWETLEKNKSGKVFKDFKTIFVDPMLSFSKTNIDLYAAAIGRLPLSMASAAEQVARDYDKGLFHEATLQDLPDTPRFIFCATNLQTGVLWRFSKPYAGDYLIGFVEKPTILLARAVAASSAFPPVLSPLVLELPQASFKNWRDQQNKTAAELAELRDRILLADGGVYDNHGLQPIEQRYMTLFVSDGGAPFDHRANVATNSLGQMSRVLDVIDNQVRALRRIELIKRLEDGNKAYDKGELEDKKTDPFKRMGAYWGINTDPDVIHPNMALTCAKRCVDTLAKVDTRLSDLGYLTSRQLVNWGYAICDCSVRKYYRGPIAILDAEPVWPYPAAALG